MWQGLRHIRGPVSLSANPYQVKELADCGASDGGAVSAEIAKERSALKKRLKVADVTFDLLGLALVPALPHFSFIAGTLAIASKPLVSRLVSRPYRWLLHTEEIDTKLSNEG